MTDEQAFLKLVEWYKPRYKAIEAVAKLPRSQDPATFYAQVVVCNGAISGCNDIKESLRAAMHAFGLPAKYVELIETGEIFNV